MDDSININSIGGYTVSNDVCENSLFAFRVFGVLDVVEDGNSSISVYPNPVKEILNITGLQKGNTIEVTDVSGKALLKVDSFSGDKEYKVPFGNLPNAVYFVKVLKQDRLEKIITVVKE